MESVDEIKTILHSSYAHALRTGDLLVFSTNEYEKMLADVDELLDASQPVKSQESNKNEITDPKVREALGLDKKDGFDAAADEVTAKELAKTAEVNKVSEDVANSSAEDAAAMSSSENVDTKQVVDELVQNEVESDLPEPNSEDATDVDADQGDADLDQNDVEQSDEIDDGPESSFDAGALLNEEYDKLVEHHQPVYHADDFAVAESQEVQPTAAVTTTETKPESSSNQQLFE